MRTKTLKEIEDEIQQIYYVYDTCKLQYHEWDLGDKLRYGRLQSMKERRLKKEEEENA
jgi:hypothetical protein